MGGTTPSQGLRYPYVDDVINESNQANLGADVAAKLTTQDAARALVIKRPFVFISSASQAIADGVDTAVIFTFVSTDPYGLVNLGTQPTRITPGSGNTGLWKFSYFLQFTTGASISKVRLSIAVTGTTRVYRSWFVNNSSTQNFVLSGMQQVAAGTDYMEFKVLHNGGGSQNTLQVYVMAWQASS